jgi:ribonuclease HII
METALGCRVAGIDEAGRGPWAGPVVAAAAILDGARLPGELAARLDDSKKLTRPIREDLFAELWGYADIGVGIAEVSEIDSVNILQATLRAMERAASALAPAPEAALIDGNIAPRLAIPTQTVVKGDSRCLSIAAASIVAKVTRDRIMEDLARAHPGYGWERNAGYGTAEHRDALARLGITPHHRRSFAPIAIYCK